MKKLGKIKKSMVLLAVFLTAGMLTGCKNTKIVVTTGLGANDVFRIGSVSCTLPEALIYLNTQKNQYEEVYGIEMWDHAFGETTLEEYLKSQVLSQLAQMKSMVYLAKEQKITLTEGQKEQAAAAAAEYEASLTETEKELLQVTEEEIQKMYEDCCLAQKAYDQITEDVAVEVSDDEARVIQLNQIYVKEEELAEELHGRIENGEDFELLAGTYSKAAKITVNTARGEKSAAYEEAAFDLDQGEVSDVFASDDGYYILQCLDTYLEEESEENKGKVEQQQKTSRFQMIYDEMMEDTMSEYQEHLWEKVHFADYQDVQTSSFFQIYESYFE